MKEKIKFTFTVLTNKRIKFLIKNTLTIINFTSALKKIFLFIFIIPIVTLSQISNVNLQDYWYNDTIITTYDGQSIFNEVWGLELSNNKYAVLGSTIGTHIFSIQNSKIEEIAFVKGKYSGAKQSIETIMILMDIYMQYVMRI